jgi:uncharacterized protein YkwD
MRGGLARFVATSMLVAVLLASSAATAPVASATFRRAKMLHKVNHARIERGIPRLRMKDFVVHAAREHNLAMAREGTLFHSSDLTSTLRRVRWHAWGENVGYGASWSSLFRAYMASPDHRANILDRRFDHVGISFVVRHDVMWSTMIFYG